MPPNGRQFMKGTKKMETKYSLAEYAEGHNRMAFLCECKKCGGKITSYVSRDEWLDIAYVLVDSDLLTKKEYNNLHHLAVSQWDFIYKTLKGAN
jgi:rRNA maturation protein Rpf1